MQGVTWAAITEIKVLIYLAISLPLQHVLVYPSIEFAIRGLLNVWQLRDESEG